jgi:hypothetical protein
MRPTTKGALLYAKRRVELFLKMQPVEGPSILFIFVSKER